ncbi:tetA, partial [Symbiodinium sp. CCMP2456]
TGCTIGPLLASQEALGEFGPIALAAAVFAVIAPAMALVLPETAPQRNEKESQVARVPLWQQNEVLMILLLLALPELGLVSHQGVALNTYSMKIGMGKPWIAKVNSASAILQALVAGTVCASLARRGWSDTTLMQLGCGSFAAASLAIFFWQSPEAIVASAPLAAAANSVLRSFPAALLSKEVPEQRQGEAMGLLDVCSSALRVAAPVLAGVLMDSFGGPSAFLFQAILFLAAVVGLTLRQRRWDKDTCDADSACHEVMAPWWSWSYVVVTVVGAGLHDRVREWSAKASLGPHS